MNLICTKRRYLIFQNERKMYRKATEKMLSYADFLSKWVGEQMPKTQDFYAISDFIACYKPFYVAQVKQLKQMRKSER